MTEALPATSLELRSLVSERGKLELTLTRFPCRHPRSQILVRVEAAPINPSDLGLLFAARTWRRRPLRERLDAPSSQRRLSTGASRACRPRGTSLSVGNEGAGTVVAAGMSPDAQALLGRTVAIAGGSMYAQYPYARRRRVCIAQGTSARDGLRHSSIR